MRSWRVLGKYLYAEAEAEAEEGAAVRGDHFNDNEWAGGDVHCLGVGAPLLAWAREGEGQVARGLGERPCRRRRSRVPPRRRLLISSRAGGWSRPRT